MKHKRVWIVGILLSIVVVLIFWIYPKIVFVKAISNFLEIDSIHVEGSLTLGNNSYELDLKGTANYSNDMLYSKFSTDYLWNPLQAELYVDKKDLKFYLTTNMNEEWVSSKQNKMSGGTSFNLSFKDINFKKVKSDRKGETKYRLTLSKKMFLTILSSYLKNSDYEKENFIMYFYTKNGNISGIEVNDKIILSKENNLYLSNIDLHFSSWNRISMITIPAEVIENSKEIDKNVFETLFS